MQQPIDKQQPTGTTRAELRSRRAVPLNLPRVEATHLLQMMNALGWAEEGGMGPVPLSSREILAWCAGMATELEPWEFEIIRATSRAFCRQRAAHDPREPNPAAPQPGQVSAIRALAAALNRKTGEA